MKQFREIVLLGPENVGKTTLYNALTCSSEKTVNYPGSTVSCKKGALSSAFALSADVVDTPGLICLQGRSAEQKETMKYLEASSERVYVLVVAATQLSRHLALADELLQRGLPFVLAISRCDQQGGSISEGALSKYHDAPCVRIDPREKSDAAYVVGAVARLNPKPAEVLAERFETGSVKRRYARVDEAAIAAGVGAQKDWSWDTYLMHPVWGFVVFITCMSLFFSCIFTLATPLMDTMDAWSLWAIGQLKTLLPVALWTEILIEGFLKGVHAALIFVPQIAILFFLMHLLEGSGYLARAAALMDKPLSLIGLGGRSFVPLMSGFACAIPASLACRSIKSPKERFLTLFVLPLLTCSARLPVFTLLIRYLFAAKWAGLVMTGLYLSSMLMAAFVSSVLSRLIDLPKRGGLLLELPRLQLPNLRTACAAAWRGTGKYVVDAGPMIVLVAAVLSVGTQFPRGEGSGVHTSYVADIGRMLEPVVEPMGLDWRAGTSLLMAFSAREVFVSALCLMYQMPEGCLTDNLRQATFDDEPGRPVFTVASASALLVFFMLALQCFPTMIVAGKEMGLWWVPGLQWLLYTGGGYLAAVFTYQFLNLTLA